MKKIIIGFSALSFILVGGIVLSACEAPKEKEKIALIIDGPEIQDNSYHQGTYNAMRAYLDDKGYRENEDYTYFVLEKESDPLAPLLEKAINWGAKGVICNGFHFEEPIFDAQQKYPDVKFLIQDGIPQKDGNIVCGSNTVAITYKEQEAGYLAGYACAREGLDRLGFIGGMAIAPVIHFGVGYIAGIYQAMSEMQKDIDIQNFLYSGTFEKGDNVKALADNMYHNGADCVFAAAGHAGDSIIESAEQNKKFVIGVDIDQSKQSNYVITSAMKHFEAGLRKFLDQFFGTWIGATTINIGVNEDGVGLPTKGAAWRFKNFSINEYEKTVEKIKVGTLNIPDDYESLNSYVDALGLKLSLPKAQIEGLQ